MMNQNSKTPTFIVYFEIFGTKKKYTVCNNLVRTQSQADLYVKTIVVPNNIKIYDADKIVKSADNTTFSKVFESISDIFGDFFKDKNEKQKN